MIVDVAVVGVTFEGRQELLAALYDRQEADDVLTGELVREPDNPYDPNAVAVVIDADHVGYLPRGLAVKWGAQMDSGEPFDVTGVRITRSDKNGKVTYGVRIDVARTPSEEAV